MLKGEEYKHCDQRNRERDIQVEMANTPLSSKTYRLKECSES